MASSAGLANIAIVGGQSGDLMPAAGRCLGARQGAHKGPQKGEGREEGKRGRKKEERVAKILGEGG